MDRFVWAGIAVCLSQSAIFSGLNLAMFGLSRLRLEAEVGSGSRAAAKILALRRDSNFLLTTILWGNVGVNTLLTLLSDSVLSGIGGGSEEKAALSAPPIGSDLTSTPRRGKNVAESSSGDRTS